MKYRGTLKFAGPCWMGTACSNPIRKAIYWLSYSLKSILVVLPFRLNNPFSLNNCHPPQQAQQCSRTSASSLTWSKFSPSAFHPIPSTSLPPCRRIASAVSGMSPTSTSPSTRCVAGSWRTPNGCSIGTGFLLLRWDGKSGLKKSWVNLLLHQFTNL